MGYKHNDLVFYYGNTHAEVFSHLDTPVLQVTNLLEDFARVISHYEQKELGDNRGAYLETFQKSLDKLIQMDANFKGISHFLNFYEAVIRCCDCFFIDAEVLESSIGQWLIQKAKSLDKIVWSVGNGTCSSPLAFMYVEANVFLKNTEELYQYVLLSKELKKLRKVI